MYFHIKTSNKCENSKFKYLCQTTDDHQIFYFVTNLIKLKSLAHKIDINFKLYSAENENADIKSRLCKVNTPNPTKI